MELSLGKASAIRILVADELGLNPSNVHLAKMYLDGEMHPIQSLNLERSGNDAAEMVCYAGLECQAIHLAEKYTLK